MKKFAALGLALLFVLYANSATIAQDDTSDKINQRISLLFTQIGSNSDIDECWDYAITLKTLFEENNETARVQLAKFVKSENEKVMMFATYLKFLVFADEETAIENSMEMLEESKDDEILKLACDLLISVEDYDEDLLVEIAEIIDERLENLSGFAKVSALKMLFYLSYEEDFLTELKKLINSKNPKVWKEAVLAIAEYDEPDSVISGLRKLAKETGKYAQLARAYVDIYEISQDIEKAKKNNADKKEESGSNMLAKPVPGQKDYSHKSFIDSLVLTVHRYLTVTEKETGTKERGDYELTTSTKILSPKYLIDRACEGMLVTRDQFCQYMTGKDMIDMFEDMSGSYGGLGARVQQEGEWIVISQPFYSYIIKDKDTGLYKTVKGPAYAAGIRSGDKIIGYFDDGSYVSFKSWALEDVIKVLKGEPGTPVKVRVLKRGKKEPIDLVITRDQVLVSTALYEMLPGKIGYIQITQFGYETDSDVEKALQALEEEGMKGLIIDLRNNPGGALTSVRNSTDKFLEGHKLIAYAQGRNREWRVPKKYYTRNAEHPRTLPLAVMINENSASGSEFFSGSLQDHKRAKIIGETSYGKGVGQSFDRLLNSVTTTYDPDDPHYNGFTRWFRLTTFAYYLPSDRSIDKVGVTPDIPIDDKIHFKGLHYKCEYSEWDGWQLAEIDRLLKKEEADDWDVIDQYILKYYDNNKELFAKLSRYDGGDYTKYPGFEEWYKSLNTKLSKDDARKLLRRGKYMYRNGGLQLMVADTRGKEFIQTFEEDVTLQRSIIEVAKEVGINLREVEEYKKFAE